MERQSVSVPPFAMLLVVGAALCSSLPAHADGRPEAPQQPSGGPGSAVAPAAKPETPAWIWAPGPGTPNAAVLARRFELAAAAKNVRVVAAVDNAGSVRLDGRELGATTDWSTPAEFAVGDLAAGAHELVVDARNEGGPAGVAAMLEYETAGGVRGRIVTDATWTVAGAAGAAPVAAAVLGKLGDAPWGGEVAAAFGGAQLGDLERAIVAPEGFLCELVYVAPKAKGSIVALAADPARRRLIASPQYGRLFALTPCKDGASDRDTTTETIEPEISGAHGVLVVENDLFAVVNESKPELRGLWRLRDEDGDGRYDSKKHLAHTARDGGEHGPHQVVLAPDGSLWVVGGNHCAPPDAALAGSRVPKLWREDVVFTRLWDPNGHAVGVMAPGGWVARTDREGARWDLLTVGFRNAYDLAFDELGRAFTFDSDMEWDFGLPWYRPTRVCELASGVDYGWRSGSGKWPAWSPDSLPPAVDVGPASPTGVLSSAGLQFPPPWNDRMFFLDWTYGTIWAGAFTDASRDASSPTMTVEPFVTGRPLPLTDAVAFDGAMYFAVGGRNLPSAVYRVRAKNPVAIKRAAATPSAALVERRALEDLHRPLPAGEAAAAVDRAFAALASPDVGVRSAARIVLEHQTPAAWRARALAVEAPAPAILALTALCRAGDPATDRAPVAARLVALEPAVRNTPHEKEWLRVCELWLLRLSPQAEGVDALRDVVLARYPAPSGAIDADELDLHRTAFLAKTGAPQAVAVAVALMERPESKADVRVDPALLARGGSYGKAVADVAANAPSIRKLGLVHAMRDARAGWTSDLRKRFALAVAELRRATGGNSYAGFLGRMADEFAAAAPESERELLATLAAGRRADEPAVSARGPGRAWTVAEVAALAPKIAAGRDHREGVRAFRAALCSRCHRAGDYGDGSGVGGPILKGVAGRFSLADVATAVVEPNRTISDQYQNVDYRTHGGRLVSGRLVREENGVLEIRTALLSDAREKLKRADVATEKPSTTSPMPAALLDTLSEQEVADLMAFLMADGDPRHPAFAPVDAEGRLEIFSAERKSPNALAAFEYDPRFWKIEDGEIVGRTTSENKAPHNTFLVWHGAARDFELEVELKVVGNNSGVQYRSEAFDGVRLKGPQIDAHPAAQYLAMVYEEGGRGILAERGRRTTIAADGTRATEELRAAAGDGGAAPDVAAWHVYRVVAKGEVMRHFLDGKPTATLIDASKDAPQGGRIGVQIHAGEPTEVRVRAIRLKRLDG